MILTLPLLLEAHFTSLGRLTNWSCSWDFALFIIYLFILYYYYYYALIISQFGYCNTLYR